MISPLLRFNAPTLPSLPEWPKHSFKKIERAKSKVDELTQHAGQGSDRFKEACKDLFIRVVSDKEEHVHTRLSTPVYLRAFIYLLYTDDEFRAGIKLNKNILEAFKKVKNPLSSYTLLQLIRAFMLHFDRLGSRNFFDALCEFLNEQLNISVKIKSELASYKKFGFILFNLNGPALLAKQATKNNKDLDLLFNEMGLKGYGNSRFLKLSRTHYYIETLKEIELGSNHHVLSELCKEEVSTAPFENGKQIGHKALEILIDRSAGTQISQEWQNVILNIAGDPRVPQADPLFQRWWQILGKNRQGLMRGWLSRFDLKLFLKVLEQSAKDIGDEEITRMFEPRKKFMEGLLKEGVISESRLFLCRNAERFLRREYKEEDLPNYAQVDSQKTSMIYLNINNKVHVLEGSHNFSIKLFDKLVTSSPLRNYDVERVSDYDLRSREVQSYVKEFGEEGYISQPHNDLKWQNVALRFLKKKGIVVPPSSVIRRESLRTYKNRYGVIR